MKPREEEEKRRGRVSGESVGRGKQTDFYSSSRKASILRFRSSGWSLVIQCDEPDMGTDDDPSLASIVLAHQSA